MNSYNERVSLHRSHDNSRSSNSHRQVKLSLVHHSMIVASEDTLRIAVSQKLTLSLMWYPPGEPARFMHSALCFRFLLCVVRRVSFLSTTLVRSAYASDGQDSLLERGAHFPGTSSGSDASTLPHPLTLQSFSVPQFVIRPRSPIPFAELADLRTVGWQLIALPGWTQSCFEPRRCNSRFGGRGCVRAAARTVAWDTLTTSHPTPLAGRGMLSKGEPT